MQYPRRWTRVVTLLPAGALVGVMSCKVPGRKAVVMRPTLARGKIRIDSQPFLVLPSARSQFGYPAAATRLSNGAIAVADAKANQVTLFDSVGQVQHRFGRTGGGQTGFRVTAWLSHCAGDTIFVWDPLRSRMTVLDQSARFVRAFALVSGPANQVSCLPGGRITYLARSSQTVARKAGIAESRRSADVVVSRHDGDSIEVIDHVLFGDIRPLGRVTLLATGRDVVYVGTADSAYVSAYTIPDGRKRTISVGAIRARAASLHHFNAFIDHMLGGMPNDAVPRARAYMRQFSPPNELPLYSGLYASRDGTLWVQLSAHGDSTTVLRAIGVDGEVLGEVELPPNVSVLEVGTDYLLASLDEESQRRVMAWHLKSPATR